MASYSINVKQDLAGSMERHILKTPLVRNNQYAHVFNVEVTNNGVPYPVGSVEANFVQSNGMTVPLDSTYCSSSGNVATVRLPQACYTVPGRAILVINCESDGGITCIAWFDCTVLNGSTENALDPGTIIPSVEALIDRIDDAVESIPADYSQLLASISSNFSTGTSYAAGAYVWYPGLTDNPGALYRFTSAHSGTWTGTDAVVVSIGNELNDTVRYTQQVHTDAEKAIARTNMGAAAAADLTALSNSVGTVPSGTTVENQIFSQGTQISTNASNIDALQRQVGTVPTGETVEGQITDLKSAIEEETGYDPIDNWASGYYETGSSKTSVDVNTIKSNPVYACAYLACSEGDVFYYTGYGSTSARPWAFLDSQGTILSRATAGSYTKQKVVVPADATTIVFNTSIEVTYQVIKGELIVNRVSTLETNVQTNTEDISNLGSQLDALFTSKSATGTGEIIDEFLRISSVSVGSAESVKVATAQMFEAKYPGVASQSGVSVTKNNDGTYTINGTASSGTWFFLNQETRTGTSNRVAVNGRYSFGYDIVSGSYDKGTYEGSTPGIIALIDLDDSPTQLASLSLGVSDSGIFDFANKAVAMAFRLTTGVIYKNLRIAIRMNKGEKLFPYTKYVTPVTLTSYGSIVSTVQNYTPYIWLTSTPSTETLTVSGKVFNSEDEGGSSSMNLYGVLEKYNDRVDVLAQMFTNPLFLVYTDIHGNADNLERINKWYSSNKPGYVSDVYCLGDMVDDQYTDAATDLPKFDKVPIWGKTLKVIGNHDVSVVAGTGPTVSATDAYNTYIAPYVSNWGVTQPSDASTYGKSYYYKDYANKIRVIVLDTYFYTEAQHDWFVATLENARTNNLAVIVAEHEDICTASEKHPFNSDYPFAKKHDGYTGLQYRTYGDGGDYQTKRNAVNSFIGDGGEFICWLVGHQHADMSGTYDGGTNGKQASVLLSNASKSMLSSMRFSNYSQDCFTYLGVDTTNKYLYLLRIGEAVDKWFHQNLFMVYDYVNHEVVEYH